MDITNKNTPAENLHPGNVAESRAAASVCAPLGKNANLNTPPPPLPLISGTGMPVLDAAALLASPDKSPNGALRARYSMQDTARGVLGFDHRVGKCLRVRFRGDSVSVLRDSTGRAHYGNLVRCGSVWSCPVCSAGIAEKRRLLLTGLAEKHKKAGGTLLLVTRTVPHTAFDDLGRLMAGLAKAETKYKSGEPYKRLVARFGIAGTARGFETTYGVNGWHPHIHEILFVDGRLTTAQQLDLKDALYERWRSACVRAGLPEPSRAHGLDLQDGTKAAGYIAKWGLEAEITKSHTKQGKVVGSLTPFDLLRIAGSAAVPERAQAQARALFKQFSVAFHGKRQLVVSPGLLARYETTMETDEEAAEGLPEAVVVATITKEGWQVVVAAKARAEVLLAAQVSTAELAACVQRLAPAHPLQSLLRLLT